MLVEETDTPVIAGEAGSTEVSLIVITFEVLLTPTLLTVPDTVTVNVSLPSVVLSAIVSIVNDPALLLIVTVPFISAGSISPVSVVP